MNEVTVKKIVDLGKQAESPKELYEMALKEGIAIRKEQAAAVYAKIKSGAEELGDDELEIVAGGVSYEPNPDPQNGKLFGAC